jgi:protoporphyrinogen oxidase
MSKERIVIIGAGPTGLGAAWRFEELGYTNWKLIEQCDAAGGLAASVVDEKDFTWDLGGHVQFSHYEYFDKLMDELLGPEGWLYHERESWVWIRKRFVPYPFQMNIRRLPREELKECLCGLVKLYRAQDTRKPRNFGEWIDASFGEGIARIFMRPYNFKVWAYPPEIMSYSWIGERVAVVDLERILCNLIDEKDDISWGPNNTFRFPKFGGTGAVWRACAERLPADKQRYGARVVRIDRNRRLVELEDGTAEPYDVLLSTMPLPILTRIAGLTELHESAQKLLYSSTHIFGIGLHGTPPEKLRTKCWMYFPEEDNPFYRVTVFSNYSPNNVPDISRFWSLMAEVSESPYKAVPANPRDCIEQVIEGLLATELIESRDQIADIWYRRLEHGYPTPSLERDSVLHEVLPALEEHDIYSRGRFGAWRYEVSNQDHSLMQGVEWVDRILKGEEELTLWHPEIVNRTHRPAVKTSDR